jgi:hypothetical protein
MYSPQVLVHLRIFWRSDEIKIGDQRVEHAEGLP